MEDRLWELFCERGDPMGYLLLCAEREREARQTAGPAPA